MFDHLKADSYDKEEIKVGFATFSLISIPIFLFDIIWWVAYRLLIVPVAPGLGDKIFWYALCLGIFQFAYSLITLGYGIAAIPASILSFFILVFLL